mmetsp:Transcript_9652/g.23763  ORF Transcript_9652/g.23763 Transcript_9652/m.23763 type:complete len:225 (-) Transcript_9652:304-978(-)
MIAAEYDEFGPLYSKAKLEEWVKGFDTEGTVSRDGEYFYLRLSKQWQDSAHQLVECIACLYKYDKSLKANQAKLRRFLEKCDGIPPLKELNFQFYAPLSDVGLHISLEAVKETDVGKRVKFTVKDLIVQRANIGVPSRHNSNFFHCQWFALAVELHAVEEKGYIPFSKGRAHISIACNGVQLKWPEEKLGDSKSPGNRRQPTSQLASSAKKKTRKRSGSKGRKR